MAFWAKTWIVWRRMSDDESNTETMRMRRRNLGSNAPYPKMNLASLGRSGKQQQQQYIYSKQTTIYQQEPIGEKISLENSLELFQSEESFVVDDHNEIKW